MGMGRPNTLAIACGSSPRGQIRELLPPGGRAPPLGGHDRGSEFRWRQLHAARQPTDDRRDQCNARNRAHADCTPRIGFSSARRRCAARKAETKRFPTGGAVTLMPGVEPRKAIAGPNAVVFQKIDPKQLPRSNFRRSPSVRIHSLPLSRGNIKVDPSPRLRNKATC